MGKGIDMSVGSTYWLSDYGRLSSAPKWLVRSSTVVLFFVSWELVGRSRKLFAVVPFSEVVARLLEDQGKLWTAAAGTLKIAAIGFILGALAGLAVGSLLGSSRLARTAFEPIVNVGVVTPMTMMIPVIGIYAGLQTRGKLLLVFMFVFFTIAINTSAGVAETPASLIETGRAFSLGRFRRYTKIVFPSALPYILLGLRLGAGRAVQGAIIADLLLRVENLGAYLVRSGSIFDMTSLLAGTFFTVLLASAVMVGARVLERRLLAWL
ncbi:MAG: ABC transporter permease [Acidimicrobiia bacterium]